MALADLNVQDAIIDGELVAEGSGGAPDFSALQDALATGHTERLVFYAFDLLYLDGYDLRRAPLLERKTALAPIIGARALCVIASISRRTGNAAASACRLGLEASCPLHDGHIVPGG